MHSNGTLLFTRHLRFHCGRYSWHSSETAAVHVDDARRLFGYTWLWALETALFALLTFFRFKLFSPLYRTSMLAHFSISTRQTPCAKLA